MHQFNQQHESEFWIIPTFEILLKAFLRANLFLLSFEVYIS